MEPHRVNPPLAWWVRLNLYDEARAQRLARETVDRHGLEQASPDARRLYNDLMLKARGIHGN